MRFVFGSFLSLWMAVLWAGADFGFRTKHTAKIQISRPPDALLRGRNITIKSRDGVPFKDLAALELALERGLSTDFTPTKDGRDLVLTFAISNYQAATAKTITLVERRNVKVGTKQGKSLITGKPIEVDDMQDRDVPVQYWEAHGALGMQITVNDAAGTLVDSYPAQSQYVRRVETAVNGVSTNTSMLPSAESLQAELIQKVASDIQRRYTKTNESVDVRLTVDAPLRAANAMAMSGQWKEALAGWSTAQMKKNPGDRAFNMAVAHEALAYQAYDASRNPDDAAGSFQQALKLYEEALRSDPGEKFFKQAMDRCAQIKKNFEQAKLLYAEQERLAQKEFAEAETRQKAEEAKRLEAEEKGRQLNAVRADTQDEADFRTIARGRVRAVSGEPDAEFQKKLVQYGINGYKLDDIASMRIVRQEVARAAKVRVNLDLYKQTFADRVGADKALDAGDQAALQRLAERLELGRDDVKPIEAQFEYKNLTVPVQAPPPTQHPKSTKPVSAPKPATPTKPAPAPTTKPASGAPVPSSIKKQ